jgi:hypothetical protein
MKRSATNPQNGAGSAFVPLMMIPPTRRTTTRTSCGGRKSRRTGLLPRTNLHPPPSAFGHQRYTSILTKSRPFTVSSLSSNFLNDHDGSSSSSSFQRLISDVDAVTNTIISTAPPKEFEPVTDWAALGTFISIMLVSILLVRRTAAVERAVMEREAALELVRTLKAKALDAPSVLDMGMDRDVGGGDGAVDSNTGTSNDDNGSARTTTLLSSSAKSLLQQALERYEAAVVQEERMRNIVPGVVRIVPPGGAGRAAEENAAVAAKQFLGKDYDIGAPKREENPSGKLPMIALGILALLGVSLTGLLILLSMDPMTVTSLMKDLQ